MGKDHVYGLSPLDVRLAGYPKVARLPCVLDFPKEDGKSAWCRQVSRSSCVTGAGAPTQKRPHNQPHRRMLASFPKFTGVSGWRASMVAWAPPVSSPLGSVGYTGNTRSDCHSNTMRPGEQGRPRAGRRARRPQADRHRGRHTGPNRGPRMAQSQRRWRSVSRQTHGSLGETRRGSRQIPVLPTPSSARRWPRAAPRRAR
jgi:hypothetical protein